MSIVVPAVLPSSRKDLEEKLAFFSAIPSVERVQIDAVDGTFASPASWPYSTASELRAMADRGETLKYLDRLAYEIDLMCADPLRSIGDWLALGATRLTFHAESVENLPDLIATVQRRYGDGGVTFDSVPLVSFGLALHIDTDPKRIEKCLDSVDYVQFMGIAHIGRQGEPFDDRVLKRIAAFRERHADVPIQVDGGVTLKNAKKLLALGVSSLVVGSAILNAERPALAVAAFENLQSPYGV